MAGNLVMVNLLTGLISNTFTLVSNDAHRTWQLQVRAGIFFFSASSARRRFRAQLEFLRIVLLPVLLRCRVLAEKKEPVENTRR